MQREAEEGATARLDAADRRLLEAEERLRSAEVAAFSGTATLEPEEEAVEGTVPATVPSAWEFGDAASAVPAHQIPDAPVQSRPVAQRLGPLPWVAAFVAMAAIVTVAAISSVGGDESPTTGQVPTVSLPSKPASDRPAARENRRPKPKPARSGRKRAAPKPSSSGPASVAAPATPIARATPRVTSSPSPSPSRPAPRRSSPAPIPQEPSVGVGGGGGDSDSTPSGDPAGRLPSP